MSAIARSSAAENSNRNRELSDASSQSQDVSRKTWYFTFDLLAGEVGVKSHLDALQSSNKLKNTTTLSFSYNADATESRTVGTERSSDNVVHIRGFISGDTMRRSSVKKMLTNYAISNLELHPISNRFDDSIIKSFLLDSALPGESAIQGCRLRVDTMQASDVTRKRAGGRPRKRPIPPECEVGAGYVPSPPPPPQRLLRGALPAPAPAGAPAPAPRSTGSISAQQPFRPSPPPAAGQSWSMGGAAAAEPGPPLLNWSSSWPQPAATPGEWQPAT